MRFISSLILALASALALPVAAQDIPDRVGRIAFIEGSAAVYQDPDEGWQQAYVNSPVSSENSLWTDSGSRAELRIGGTAMRLDETTQVDLSRLDDSELAAYIPRGTVAVRVRHLEPNERVTLSTPHASFTIRANGRYRIDVDPDREESRLTVFTGDARVGSDSGRLRVGAGKTVRVFGGSSPSYVMVNAVADPFDGWAQQRDAGWVETRSVQYLSPNMTGYEDLDRYGQWSNEADLGALWYPTRVASDWAPYRYGHWDYVRPWGWTWIDDASWGYAPFHYGRWVQVRDRWAWSPGKRELRPTWAPALVAWIGGAGFNATISGGSPSVGWYPLSPWERYQPWYNASPTYVNRVNLVVLASPQRDDQRQWSERTRDRGATVVSREAVVDRRPVQQARVAFKPETIRQAAVTTPAAALPARNEVIQRRQSPRTQAAQTNAPTTATPAGKAPAQTAAIQRGERAGPVAKPDFARRTAAAPPAPEPAKAAPPPVQRVAPPSATGQQQARDQQNAREAQQKGQADAQKGREAEAQKARDQQNAREAQQKGQADAQKGREAEAQKAREAQVQQQQAQQKGREAEAQKAREAQLQQQQAQQKGREAEAQKARDAQQQQQAQQRAQQQQQQAQERAAQQKAQPQPPVQERAQPQPPVQERAQPPQKAQPSRQEKGKATDDSKDKDDEEKKARSR